MFQLNDRIRRWLCRAIFIVCCLLLTLTVGAWSLAPRLGFYHVLHQQRLARELAADVRLGRAEQPRPGVMRWTKLELLSDEQADWLATIDSLELDRRAEFTILRIERPRVSRAGLAWLWSLATEQLRRTASKERGIWRLEIRGAQLIDEEETSELGDVVGDFEFQASGSQLTLRFDDEDRSEADRMHLRLVRNRQTTPATSGVELRTGATPLPCSLLGLWLKHLGVLGPAAEFRGQLWAIRSGDRWEVELAGQLLGVELRRLVGTVNSDLHLQGTADVALDRARWREGRMAAISGLVEAGPGTVNRGLVLAASEGLRWRVRRSLYEGEPTDLIPYERLAAGFALDESGLLTEGRCAGSLDGILLQDALGPLLAHSEQGAERVPVAHLVRTLAPSQDVALPANREAQTLWQVLPAPSHGRTEMARQVKP